ncbi:Transcription initiation factor TFIID subunit 4b [Striga hermonthica]|uniref:Transcription initiation factor TFIID subunit 4b n=1 Tax=Striga hermonthica TaxID=68872 RepID=A0A9N7R0S2_STRHE|nr:Transcription initiation factor TFIID subunit 4b [Striga hermonthica]
MKFLEEDEDETMHSGADVEAFTAELNRDIEGNASTSQQQPSDSDNAAMSHGGSETASHFLPQWQTSTQDGIVNSQTGQGIAATEEKEQLPSQSSQQQHIFEPENRKEDAFPHNPSTDASSQRQDDGKNVPASNTMTAQTSREQPIHIHDLDSESNLERESQMEKLQNVSNHSVMGMSSNDQRPVLMESKDQHSVGTVMSGQQAMTSGLNNQQSMASGSQKQQGSSLKLNRQVPFGMLLPIIQPQLDKDRAMQLHTLYFKLKKNEISKDGFIRHMRSIVGDQMLKMAVFKLQTQDVKNTQIAANQFQSQPQTSARQMQLPSNVSSSTSNVNTREEMQTDSPGLQASHMPTPSPSSLTHDRKHSSFPGQGLNKQPHNMHISHASFPTYGSTANSYPPFTNAAPQMRQGSTHQNIPMNHLGHTAAPPGMLHPSNFDRAHPLGEAKKMQQGGLTHVQQKTGVSPSTAHVKQENLDQPVEQHNALQGSSSLSRGPIKQVGAASGNLNNEPFEMQSSRMGFAPSTNVVSMNSVSSSNPSPMEPNIQSQPRSITPSMGIGNNSKAAPKKPLAGQKKQMEPPGSSPPSKKQKVSGGFLDQSIEHLNDVTAVSGVNLREEEEQLFSGAKEDSRVSEASRKVVQEEEERLILNKIPLQKKVVEIMAKCGLKNMTNDVERCLSLCVEERMRGLISNLIRLSKQRVDFEKPRHKIIVTSDVRRQILTINHKARKEWDKKQAETEKSQKPNETENASGVDGDKDKDETRGKSAKANKEEDDKMRATAANVAVRAATGVGDMLSRWQLMIEAKQKQGGSDTLSGSQPGKDMVAARKSSATSLKKTRENQEADRRDPSAATPASVRKMGRNQVVIPRVVRSISVKDVIAILEREPQMSRSTLLYRLYNKVTADVVVE